MANRAVPTWSRRAFSLVGLMGALVVLAGMAGAAVWWFSPALLNRETQETILSDPVKVGAFVYDVVERGEVESSSNVEVRSEVQSRGAGGGVAIIQIVPEGTIVQPGDFLVKMDDSALLNELTQQKILCNTSEAAVIQAASTLATAKIAKQEYLDGTFKQEEATLLSEVFVAEENLRRAEAYAEYSKTLLAKNYYTQAQYDADLFAVEKAKTDLELANTKLEVLRKYTQAKMVEQLDADIKTAEANLKSQQESNQLDRDKLALIQQQIDKCTITAPASGQVVYANESGRRGGAEVVIEEGVMVRERQVIIRLPDATKMQVNAKINESRVDYVAEGLPVKVRLDALPGVELDGRVSRVDAYPIPSSWWGSSVKEYGTIVEIDNPPPSIRPGMTAEVAIRVAQIAEAEQVPVHAVFERGGKNWCLTLGPGGKIEPREIEIGITNDKFVVVDAGLDASDRVVANPRKYLNRVDLPADAQVSEKEMLAGVPDGLPARGSRATAIAAAGPNGPQGGAPVAEGAARPDPSAMVGRMLERDQNGDGKLDATELAEIPEQFRTGLMAGDTDGDGAISEQELRAVISRFSGAAAGGRPPDTSGGGGAGP